MCMFFFQFYRFCVEERQKEDGWTGRSEDINGRTCRNTGN